MTPHPADERRRVRPAAAVKASAGRRRASRFPAILAGAVACALFLPALAYDFVRDDRELLLEGSLLRSHGALGRLLATDYWSASGGVSGLWRPFVTLTLWIDGRLSGWSPAWFHATNLITHGLTTYLLVRAVAAAGGGPFVMGFTGLWFACMPAHVESVAWIAGRTDLWCALFAIAALVLARGGRAARRAGPVAWALALLSKESAAAIAPVFALPPDAGGARRPERAPLARPQVPPPDATMTPVSAVAWTTAQVPVLPAPAAPPKHFAPWRAIVPYAAVSVAWAVLHALLVGPVTATPGLAARGAARLWTALAIPAWELRFLVPGVGHGPDWRLAPLATPGPAAFLGLAIHAGAIVLLVRLVTRRDPVALPLAVLWLPLAGMSALALARGVLFSGERHIYLASAGAAWAAGLGLERAMRTRRVPGRVARGALPALAVILIATSAGDTLLTLPAWRDDTAMYDAMTGSQPHNATGPLGQALARIDRGDDAGAWEALARAAAIDSSRYEIALYRAGIVLRRGRPEEAMALARQAEARVGWNRDARLIEALALQQLGRWSESRAVLADLRARAPDDDDVQRAWAAQRAAEARGARRAPPR